ncbi:MAG TPA: sensor histidine kinase, partial [Myxococcota bacterium]|nr:sensor histidine kinase [Myxococcota bacterium]
GGDIEVRLRAAQGGVDLSVRDHGIGIAPEDQGRIFERFERAVSTRNYGGLGLGLFIVREIVRLHGGTIEVASALGRGATFTVRLPQRPAQDEDGAREDAAARPEALPSEAHPPPP